MTRIIVIFIALTTFACTQSDAEFCSRGWHWVHVMNPDGICNENYCAPFGDECGIDLCVGMATHVKDDVFKYHRRTPAAGTECPNGTAFISTQDEVDNWTKEARTATKEYMSLRDRMRETLK